jgi:hypothetical protein
MLVVKGNAPATSIAGMRHLPEGVRGMSVLKPRDRRMQERLFY